MQQLRQMKDGTLAEKKERDRRENIYIESSLNFPHCTSTREEFLKPMTAEKMRYQRPRIPQSFQPVTSSFFSPQFETTPTVLIESWPNRAFTLFSIQVVFATV